MRQRRSQFIAGDVTSSKRPGVQQAAGGLEQVRVLVKAVWVCSGLLHRRKRLTPFLQMQPVLPQTNKFYPQKNNDHFRVNAVFYFSCHILLSDWGRAI